MTLIGRTIKLSSRSSLGSIATVETQTNDEGEPTDMPNRSADRHSFTRTPDCLGWTHCKHCGLSRRHKDGKRQYLDGFGRWIEEKYRPSCTSVRQSK